MPNKTTERYRKISSQNRLIRRGKTNVKIMRRGIKRITRHDFYVASLSTPWFQLVIAIAFFYTLLNCIFAGLYLLQDGSIENARPGSFSDAFFFSVQTLATIGYGKMNPATLYGNILVTCEALIGLSGLAVATGVIFSKLSRPNARIIFGNKALISKYRDMECFMFRLGNLRSSQIAEPTIKAVLIQDEPSSDGLIRRVFHDLNLIKSNTPLLMPSWTVRHQITSSSPLFKATKEILRQRNIEIIVSVTGFDEVLSQTVHTHHSYIASEVVFGGNFVDIISWDSDGRTQVDYARFHDIK